MRPDDLKGSTCEKMEKTRILSRLKPVIKFPLFGALIGAGLTVAIICLFICVALFPKALPPVLVDSIAMAWVIVLTPAHYLKQLGLQSKVSLPPVSPMIFAAIAVNSIICMLAATLLERILKLLYHLKPRP